MSIGHTATILAGSLDDPHVQVVVDRLPKRSTVVLDATNVVDVVENITESRIVLRDLAGGAVEMEPGHRAHGWVRRLYPHGWQDGVILGGRMAATVSSRLALLAAVIRDPCMEWLTPIDALFAAENKLFQYRTAVRLGIRVPRTVAGAAVASFVERSRTEVILKPLGPGAFIDESGSQRVVFARTVAADRLQDVDVRDAPFIGQERLKASKHLRIVTVADTFWVSELAGDGLPTDWRRDESAHHSFVESRGESDVGTSALRIARALGCRYSSQDWIVDSAGPAFIDLNPNGQWLFLPDGVADAVTEAICSIVSGTV